MKAVGPSDDGRYNCGGPVETDFPSVASYDFVCLIGFLIGLSIIFWYVIHYNRKLVFNTVFWTLPATIVLSSTNYLKKTFFVSKRNTMYKGQVLFYFESKLSVIFQSKHNCS